MSDPIKHECGIAVIRLRKPLEYYKEKYGTIFWGLNKLNLLMEKQHNRGQDGAGMGVVKLGMKQGQKYMEVYRDTDKDAITKIFNKLKNELAEVRKRAPEFGYDTNWLKLQVPFAAELLMGHLRYGTYAKNQLENCHPFINNRQQPGKTLMMAGNFNLTNIDKLGWSQDEDGYKPDTVVVLDCVSKHLEEAVDRIYATLPPGATEEQKVTAAIKNIDWKTVLSAAEAEFDGGYVLAGLSGMGYAFVMRDPNGIRPAYYYANDEVVAVASERPCLQTTFNAPLDEIHELPAANAIIIDRVGGYNIHQIGTPQKKSSCSFERIYFSRGSDVDIYAERKKLGYLLTNKVLETINYDLENTVFSYIPNTAETAFYGLLKGLEDYLNNYKKQKLRTLDPVKDSAEYDKTIEMRPRVEKIAIKDVKMRTFITQDEDRDEMVQHVYDITYGSIKPGIDTIVVIDDSIVRGTTLKQSIIRMLDRLKPRRIVIVSSAPQIRYPDCYGIDMSKMKDFIAFQALADLVKENGREDLLQSVYAECIRQKDLPPASCTNAVKPLYDLFTDEQLSDRIAHLVTDKSVQAAVKVVYQTVDNLHIACPNHTGDWYFTGNYPTHGGNKVANKAFIYYIEGIDMRAY